MPSFLGMDLRGHLDLLLLATLHRTGPAHGYAMIAALRETSVLFAALLGAWQLQERFTPRRALGTAAILAGVAALRLG